MLPGRVHVVAPAAVVPQAGGGGLHRARDRDGLVPGMQRRSPNRRARVQSFQANEVAIGMVLPYPALEVLRLRLTPSAYQQAVGLAKVFFGETALAAGWVTRSTCRRWCCPERWRPPASSRRCRAGAHLASKIRARQSALDAIKAGIDNIHTEFGLS